MTRGGWLLIGRLATGMDRVTNRYFAKTADPSTALRFGRDDKGRVVTFRKASDWDGQSYQPLLRDTADPSAALRSDSETTTKVLQRTSTKARSINRILLISFLA